MDEYFCPNCGATLNYQPGFDPSRGEWTCTECGQQLMDDDTYDGDTFEGVAWHCDNCGALLNKQYGFSDSYGTWTCTECGHTNGTTEDDIIEGTHFTCPECGATLNNQSCFNQYSDDWECTSCGAKLHHSYHDDEYSVVEDKFSCPNCGDTLDEQWCFADYLNDWTCTKCGAHLHHNYSDDEYTVVDDEDGEEEKLVCPNCEDDLEEQIGFEDYLNDWVCSVCGAHLHRDFDDDPFEVADTEDDDSNADDTRGHTHETSYVPPQYKSSETSKKKTTKPPQKEEKLPESELRKKRLKAFFFRRKKIEIGYDPLDLLRRNIEYVQTALYNKAFTNVRAIPVKDIYTGSTYQVGEVEQIVIGGSAFFEKEDNIPYDTEIVVTYHEKREITIPYSAHSLRKKNYIAVGDELQSLGFTEIYERQIKDLTTGWVKKDGSIEKVSVDGNSDFKKNSTYKYDTKIVIEYHTFKKKK